MFGFVTQTAELAPQAAWRLEQIRSAARDKLYRRADTLPTASKGTFPKTTAVTATLTAASYADSVRKISATQTTIDFQGVGLESMPKDLSTSLKHYVILPPEFHRLTGFRHVYQTPNNCGPAALAVALSYYGWLGDQREIASLLKPQVRDKNVRGDELVHYVRNHAGWLDAMFRVGGNIAQLELLIANGYPVIIETGYEVETGWVGHYLVATGYDRPSLSLIVQDVTGGPSQVLPYSEVDTLWRQFNRLYIPVFPAPDRDKVLSILGPDAKLDVNRRRALLRTREETETYPQDAFAWFSYGSNLTYFDRYREASLAYDRARQIGLPWRVLFYQFGPYIAYFNVGRYQDVVDLATVTLQARPDLEESYVWRGWARYMLGHIRAAEADFRAALRVNPYFLDAITALNSVGEG